jgi:hypothetical protein
LTLAKTVQDQVEGEVESIQGGAGRQLSRVALGVGKGAEASGASAAASDTAERRGGRSLAGADLGVVEMAFVALAAEAIRRRGSGPARPPLPAEAVPEKVSD